MLFCCELLSKIIIFVTRHNALLNFPVIVRVVNCFQKLLSSWHDTTFHDRNAHSLVLWIAFKNYYLRDTTQLMLREIRLQMRCELLSKIIIFVTRHNPSDFLESVPDVVNCFQKLLSSWHDTTENLGKPKNKVLWIAFKNYYLRDTTQPANA